VAYDASEVSVAENRTGACAPGYQGQSGRADFWRLTVHNPFIVIPIRYIHIITACVLLGGAFFFRVLLPIGVKDLDPEARETVLLRSRRGFKMIVHSAFFLLLLTGAYSAVLYWPIYTLWPPVMHGLFGLHLLLGLLGLILLMIVTAGPQPLRSYMSIAKVALIVIFLAVLAASVLKWEREQHSPAGPGYYQRAF
jgi:uncharacterized membrane protein